ncbi:A24 family peptidase, partial [Burkholderia sp. BCC1995]
VSYRLPRILLAGLEYPADESTADSALPRLAVPAGMVPEGKALSLFQASACPNCGNKIPARANIPIFGWLVVRGRCVCCHAPISIRYPMIELVSAAAAGMCLAHFGATLEAIAAFAFLWCLLLAAVIDLETMFLPDCVTQSLLWLGLGLAAFGAIRFLPVPSQAILGAMAGYMIVFIPARIGQAMIGREMMGEGDFKLNAAIGAWLGWEAIPVILLVAATLSVIGHAAVSILRGGARRAAQDSTGATDLISQGYLPFGPWLAGAAALMLLAGRFGLGAAI